MISYSLSASLSSSGLEVPPLKNPSLVIHSTKKVNEMILTDLILIQICSLFDRYIRYRRLQLLKDPLLHKTLILVMVLWTFINNLYLLINGLIPGASHTLKTCLAHPPTSCFLYNPFAFWLFLRWSASVQIIFGCVLDVIRF